MKLFIRTLALPLVIVALTGCQRAGEAAKETINKGGEVAGQAASEFLKGAKEGVEETMAISVELDPSLTEKGMVMGKSEIASVGYSTLNVYLALDRDFNDTLLAKAFDADGLEMGRVRFGVSGRAGDAGWHALEFPQETDLEAKGRVVIAPLK
jgi:hypothetical protein